MLLCIWKERLWMYSVEDLFDKRSVVGTRLEQILAEKSYTKAELCKKAGVSRPTLDKLLMGTLTSKTNYEKHISKILDCLGLTPDMLLGNVQNGYNRTREIRSIMRMSAEEIAEATGISVARLKEIEAGENATIAELRDIALCLSVSVKGLLGTNFFEAQIAEMDCYLENDEEDAAENLSGFWGHIGILPYNADKYIWFPITGSTRKLIYNMMDNDKIVVPCMNNRVLLLNMKNVKEIMLLDDACDQPEFANWDTAVDCGEFPLVVYEALEDYLYYLDEEKISNDVLSAKFRKMLDNIMEHKGWSEEQIYDMLDISAIYFADGRIRPINIDFDDSESISGYISAVYDFGESAFSEKMLFCHDLNGAEIMLNMEKISALELPLLKVENAICDTFEELDE